MKKMRSPFQRKEKKVKIESFLMTKALPEVLGLIIEKGGVQPTQLFDQKRNLKCYSTQEVEQASEIFKMIYACYSGCSIVVDMLNNKAANAAKTGLAAAAIKLKGQKITVDNLFEDNPQLRNFLYFIQVLYGPYAFNEQTGYCRQNINLNNLEFILLYYKLFAEMVEGIKQDIIDVPVKALINRLIKESEKVTSGEVQGDSDLIQKMEDGLDAEKKSIVFYLERGLEDRISEIQSLGENVNRLTQLLNIISQADIKSVNHWVKASVEFFRCCNEIRKFLFDNQDHFDSLISNVSELFEKHELSFFLEEEKVKNIPANLQKILRGLTEIEGTLQENNKEFLGKFKDHKDLKSELNHEEQPHEISRRQELLSEMNQWGEETPESFIAIREEYRSQIETLQQLVSEKEEATVEESVVVQEILPDEEEEEQEEEKVILSEDPEQEEPVSEDKVEESPGIVVDGSEQKSPDTDSLLKEAENILAVMNDGVTSSTTTPEDEQPQPVELNHPATTNEVSLKEEILNLLKYTFTGRDDLTDECTPKNYVLGYFVGIPYFREDYQSWTRGRKFLNWMGYLLGGFLIRPIQNLLKLLIEVPLGIVEKTSSYCCRYSNLLFSIPCITTRLLRNCIVRPVLSPLDNMKAGWKDSKVFGIISGVMSGLMWGTIVVVSGGLAIGAAIPSVPMMIPAVNHVVNTAAIASIILAIPCYFFMNRFLFEATMDREKCVRKKPVSGVSSIDITGLLGDSSQPNKSPSAGKREQVSSVQSDPDVVSTSSSSYVPSGNKPS